MEEQRKKYSQKPKICVSEDLKKILDKLGNKGDRYEDIIWRLVKGKKK